MQQENFRVGFSPEKLAIKIQNQLFNMGLVHKSIFSDLTTHSSKNNIVGKLNTLIQSYEIMLMDIGSDLYAYNLQKLTELIFKIFYQIVSVTRWSLEVFMDSQTQLKIKNANDDYIKMADKVSDQKKQINKQAAYKMKQNYDFMVRSIDDSLHKMKEEYEKEEKQYEYEKLVQKKEKINNIKPTDREVILIQAIQSVANQSQMFKQFVNTTNSKFFEDYKALNVIPYFKIKDEIDRAHNKKLKKANTKISKVIQHHFDTIIKNFYKKNTITYSSVEAQTEKQVYEQILKREIKEKQGQIQIQKAEIKFLKDRIEGLEKIFKEKSHYFEKELIRVQVEHKENKDIQTLRKSVHELESARALGDEQIQQENEDLKNDPFLKIERNLEKLKKNSSSVYKKKKIRFQKEEESDPVSRKTYKKCSITFLESNPNIQYELEKPLKQCQIQNQIYQIANPQNIEGHCSPYATPSYLNAVLPEHNKKQNRYLNIDSNVVDLSLSGNLRIKPQKKQSLIMIKGMSPIASIAQGRRQSKRGIKRFSQELVDDKVFKSFRELEKSNLPQTNRSDMKRVSIKCLENRKTKNNFQEYEEDKSNIIQNTIACDNPKILLKSTKQMMMSDENKADKKNNLKKPTIENVFEIINLDTHQLKTKQLKISNFKRNYKQAFESLQADNRCMKTQTMAYQDVIDLFLNEENAMQAEITFSSNPITIQSKQEALNSSQFYKKIEPILYRMQKNHKIDLLKVKKMIRFPFSTMNQDTRKILKVDHMSLGQLRHIFQYIEGLHLKCTINGLFCNHLNSFIRKLQHKKQ